MAKKKSSQRPYSPSTPTSPRTPRTPTATAAAAAPPPAQKLTTPGPSPLSKVPSSDKVESLKALNGVLVKETLETRVQMKNLQTHMVELSVDLDHSLLAGLDRLVALTVLESEAEEKRGLILKERSELERRLEEAEAARGGLERMLEGVTGSLKRSEGKLVGDVKRLEEEIGLARKEDEVKTMRASELERKNAELLEEIGRLNVELAAHVEDKSMRERHFEVAKEELIGRKAELRRKLEMVVGERDELLGKNGELCSEIGSMKMKDMENSMRVSELERTNRDLKGEIGKIKGDLDGHVEKETSFEVARMVFVGKLGELEGKVEALEKEKEGNWRKNQGEIASWKKKDDAKSLKISELERRNEELSDTIDLLKGTAEVISLTVSELEAKNVEFRGEIGRLNDELNFLLEDNEEKERGFQLAAKETLQKVGELEKNVKGLVKEKGDVQRRNGKLQNEFNLLKKESEAKISQLETDIQKLAAEKEKNEELAKALVEEKDEMEDRKVERLRCEIEKLNVELNKHVQDKGKKETSFKLATEELEQQIKELKWNVEVVMKERDGIKKKNGELRNEIEKLKVELKKQIEDKGKKERSFKASSKELAQQTEELKRKMKAVTEEKDGMETEIHRLREEVDGLSTTASELQKTTTDQAEEIKVLQAGKRDLQKMVDQHKNLRKQIKELHKGRDSVNQEVRKLKEEKASTVSGLSIAQRDLREMGEKMNTATTLYQRALAMMKSSAKAMRGGATGEINGVGDELKRNAMEDKELRPFVSELESVKKAYKSRGEDMEMMKRELKVLQELVKEAKTKGSFWVLMTSIMGAIAVLAVAAYAAKLH